jgi:type VI protein secretion system component Hcp
MSTKTIVAVVAVIAAAIIGGAVIWAATDEGESTRAAVIGSSATGPTSYRLSGFPTPNQFAVGSYSVGMTKTRTTTTTDKYGSSGYEPLRFSKPLDDVSLNLFHEAARSRLQQKVTLQLLRQSQEDPQPSPVLEYELLSAVLAKSAEGAANGGRSRQDVELVFKSMSIVVPSPGALGYASGEGSVGYVVIPGIASEPDGSKPAYVVSYSWGWENPDAAAIAAGATTLGRFTVDSITIERRLDNHAPTFWQALIQGKPWTEIELHLKQPNTEGDEPTASYTTYKLTNAQVVSVHDAGGEDPMETIKLDFAPIELRSGQNVETFTAGSKAR